MRILTSLEIVNQRIKCFTKIVLDELSNVARAMVIFNLRKKKEI